VTESVGDAVQPNETRLVELLETEKFVAGLGGVGGAPADITPNIKYDAKGPFRFESATSSNPDDLELAIEEGSLIRKVPELGKMYFTTPLVRTTLPSSEPEEFFA
jgi:hypothetical protein